MGKNGNSLRTLETKEAHGVQQLLKLECWKIVSRGQDVDYKSCLESLRASCGQIEDLP